MQRATRLALDDLNRRFYREHAGDFSRSRARPWPGFERAFRDLARREVDRPFRVLDVGCGNGRLGEFLHARAPLAYCGLDASPPLLADAACRLAGLPEVELREADCVRDSPDDSLPRGPFDGIALLGVLHHVPGRAERAALLGALSARLAPGGRLVFTVWRFADGERFERRRVAWCDSPLFDRTADLEPGDHLLRWGDAANPALRYCHALDDAECEALIAQLALRPVDRFFADGKDGSANLYLVLQRD